MNIHDAKVRFDLAKSLEEKPVGIRRHSWPAHWLYVTVDGFEDTIKVRPTKEMIEERRQLGVMGGTGWDLLFKLNIENLCAGDWEVVW